MEQQTYLKQADRAILALEKSRLETRWSNFNSEVLHLHHDGKGNVYSVVSIESESHGISSYEFGCATYALTNVWELWDFYGWTKCSGYTKDEFDVPEYWGQYYYEAID
jgi:hypothetical protein